MLVRLLYASRAVDADGLELAQALVRKPEPIEWDEDKTKAAVAAEPVVEDDASGLTAPSELTVPLPAAAAFPSFGLSPRAGRLALLLLACAWALVHVDFRRHIEGKYSDKSTLFKTVIYKKNNGVDLSDVLILKSSLDIKSRSAPVFTLFFSIIPADTNMCIVFQLLFNK